MGGTEPYEATLNLIHRHLQPDNLTVCMAQRDDGSLPDGPVEEVLAFNVLHLLEHRTAVFNSAL